MQKSSHYLQALFGVLAGGTRRKPRYLKQQALVSKIYPYFDAEAFGVSSIGLSGGVLSKPYLDSATFTSSILTGGSVRALRVEYESGNETLQLSSWIIEGGNIKNTRVDYDAGNEPLQLSSSLRAGGVITAIAIRYDSTTHDENAIAFTSSILTGGSIGD